MEYGPAMAIAEALRKIALALERLATAAEKQNG